MKRTAKEEPLAHEAEEMDADKMELGSPRVPEMQQQTDGENRSQNARRSYRDILQQNNPNLQLEMRDNPICAMTTTSPDLQIGRTISVCSWMIGEYGDNCLVIREWVPNFVPEEDQITKLMAWVRISKLGLEYFHKHFLLNKIGSKIGRVIKLNNTMANVERGQFTRLCAEIDIMKPLLSKFRLNGHIWKIQYEGLCMIYFNCGKQGHKEERCPLKTVAQEGNSVVSSQQELWSTTDSVSDEQATYSSWMMERKPRRKSTRASNPRGAQAAETGGERNLGDNRERNVARRGTDPAGSNVRKEAVDAENDKDEEMPELEEAEQEEEQARNDSEIEAEEGVPEVQEAERHARSTAQDKENSCEETGSELCGEGIRVPGEQVPQPLGTLSLNEGRGGGDTQSQQPGRTRVLLDRTEQTALDIGLGQGNAEPWLFTVMYLSPCQQAKERF
ncbi:hypothetical protein Cgig2_017217 [Carnegiea gigantea]|uniref:CCHC-type domain-containing protein n=1 Tax=Carnegiea gigantea TaxID=171969 RepID=A0A9Q1KGS7_9CARY|nr:hypothetical protein Cgig2_017217 [Carnegiea gigantea]